MTRRHKVHIFAFSFAIHSCLPTVTRPHAQSFQQGEESSLDICFFEMTSFQDIETVDSSLASSLQAVNSSLATFAASVITVTLVARYLYHSHPQPSISSVIFPLFLVPASIIGFVYRMLAIGYLNTGRDLRRMESNSRSPIFSGFGELLEGIVTVRAFSAEQRFLDSLHAKVDLTTQV